MSIGLKTQKLPPTRCIPHPTSTHTHAHARTHTHTHNMPNFCVCGCDKLVSTKGLIAGKCQGEYKDMTEDEKKARNGMVPKLASAIGNTSKAKSKARADMKSSTAAYNAIPGGGELTEDGIRSALKEKGHNAAAVNGAMNSKASNAEISSALADTKIIKAANNAIPGGGELTEDGIRSALKEKGHNAVAVNAVMYLKARNAKISAALVEKSVSNASNFNPEVYSKHTVFLQHIDDIVKNIINETPVLQKILKNEENWEKASLYIMGLRTSEDKALDRWDLEWYSFAHARHDLSYPIVTEHDGTTLTKNRLEEMGFIAQKINCTFMINGVAAFPTPMKEVNNAVEKLLHSTFSNKLAVGRRLWLVDGQGGVGANRNTLNSMFKDCNLKPRRECQSKEERATWDIEKAKWEVQTNFTFTVGIAYLKDGLPEDVKLQYDRTTNKLCKKSTKRAFGSDDVAGKGGSKDIVEKEVGGDSALGAAAAAATTTTEMGRGTKAARLDVDEGAKTSEKNDDVGAATDVDTMSN